MAAAYSAKNVTVGEGDEEAVFDVLRSGKSDDMRRESSVNFETQDVSAKAGTDYTATSGTLEFAPNETSKEISVAILPEAFEKPGIETFLLKLKGYGAAMGAISEKHNTDQIQAYWLIPGDGDSLAVPTTDSASAAAKAQMDVSEFSDPPTDEAHQKLAQTYIRIGHARPDMNFPERLIAEADAFFPYYKSGGAVATSGGVPQATGAAHYVAAPRNVYRYDLSSTQVDDDKKNNKHLDGILMYTAGNFTTSIAGTSSNAIGGNYSISVGGDTFTNYQGNLIQSIAELDGGDVHRAFGTMKVDDGGMSYNLLNANSLSVKFSNEQNLFLGDRLNASVGTALNIATSASYNINNSIKMDYSGLQVAGRIGLLGTMELDTSVGTFSMVKNSIAQSALTSVTLGVSPIKLVAIQTALGTAASVVSMAASLVQTTVLGIVEAKDMSVDVSNNLASPGTIKKIHDLTLGATWNTVIQSAAATGAALALATAFAQQKLAAAPGATPKIRMTPTTMTLSVGPACSIVMSAEMIEVDAPDIFLAGTSIDFSAPEISMTGTTAITGDVEVTGASMFTGDMLVNGDVVATMLVGELV